MSLNIQHFQFDQFLLDVEERVLWREGKPVSITPKTFSLLQVLVENHGHVVEKEQLMAAAWADSFVEEGNLSFTINRLRRALGDDSQHPVFIQTIPRRGYRFIATVNERIPANGENTARAPDPKAISVTTIPGPTRKLAIPILGALIMILAIAGIGSWYARSNSSEPSAPILSASFGSESFSTDGQVHHAAISPDGKSVVYTSGFRDKQSVWLRQLETSSNVQIIPPSDDFYYGLAFSTDGNSVYFTRRPKFAEKQADIYRVSVFGGVPDLLVNDTQGWISLSPVGSYISFVRCDGRNEDNCSLWVANAATGQSQRKLTSRPSPFRIGVNKISPDGKTIAFAVGQSRNEANEFSLVEIDIETGQERELTVQRFFNIKGLAWLANQSGLLMSASVNPDTTYRLWQVSSEVDSVIPITNDSSTYSELSLDRDATTLIGVKVKAEFRLQFYDVDLPTTATRDLADATSVVFAGDGKIFFSSSMTGNDEIWSIKPDGSEQRQLTNDVGRDSAVAVSADSNSVFFTSNRSGSAQIWQMNADGSNQTQITRKEGGFPLRVSLDGQWLYYRSSMNKTLWRVSLIDGKEEMVLNRSFDRITVSPDGSQAAFPDDGDNLTIVSLVTNQIEKVFKLPQKRSNLTGLVWSQNGSFLAFTIADREFQNNSLWFQPIDNKGPKQIADLGVSQVYEVSGFALAPNGENFAVVQGGWKHDAILFKGLK